MYGLTSHTIEAVQEVFNRHPEVERAILYGSRAMGNYRSGSDIDISLKGDELDLTLLQRIENELDDLYLPYKIDLSNYHQISNPDLLKHIDQVGKVFFERPKHTEG